MSSLLMDYSNQQKVDQFFPYNQPQVLITLMFLLINYLRINMERHIFLLSQTDKEFKIIPAKY